MRHLLLAAVCCAAAFHLCCGQQLQQRDSIFDVSTTEQKERCPSGHRMVAVDRSRSSPTASGSDKLPTSSVTLSGIECSPLQRAECTRDCAWRHSCRLAPSWCRYSEGRRTYVAGARMNHNSGKLEFYCCASFAASFDMCSWSRARPLRGDGSLAHLAALQVVSGHAPATDAVLRDFITDPYGGKVTEYRVEVCKVSRERARCAVSHMPPSEQRAFRLLLFSAARADQLATCQERALNEASVHALRQDMFEERQELPPPAPPTTTAAPTSRRAGDSATTTTTQAAPQCPQHPAYNHCISDSEADRRFSQCCVASNIKPDCLHLCSYQSKKKQVIQAVASGLCDSNTFNQVLRCASQNTDVTACCDALKLVTGTYAICRPFCDPAVSDIQIGSIRYLPCTERLKDISQCYIAYMNPL